MRYTIAVSILACALTTACGNFVDGYYAVPLSGGAQQGNTTIDGQSGDANIGSSLVVGNYDDGSTTVNDMKAAIDCDFCNVTNSNGALHFTYNGSGDYFGVSNAMRSTWCEYDVSQYTSLSFDMWTVGTDKKVDVIIHTGDGTCPQNPRTKSTSVITVGRDALSYSLPLGAIDRKHVISIEMDPETLDGSQYSLDNLRFNP